MSGLRWWIRGEIYCWMLFSLTDFISAAHWQPQPPSSPTHHVAQSLLLCLIFSCLTMDGPLWRHVWSYLDAYDAARVAPVSRLFREAPEHCVRLTVDDSVLLTPAYLWQFRKWFDKDQQPEPKQKQEKKLELLYRYTRDNIHRDATNMRIPAAIFHERCDNKGPTLTVVRGRGEHQLPGQTEPPTYLFGAYTDIPWTSPPETAEELDYVNSDINVETDVLSVNRNDKTFLFALTYERCFQNQWTRNIVEEEDSENESENPPPGPDPLPVRKPYRFAGYASLKTITKRGPRGSSTRTHQNFEVLHGRGIGPGFFWGHDRKFCAPALYFDCDMICCMGGDGGKFTKLHLEAQFQCEDERVVQAFDREAYKDDYFWNDLLPFEFDCTEGGFNCAALEVEVFLLK